MRKLVVIGLVAGTIAISGVAFAAWTSRGEGEGSATALRAVDLSTSVATPVAGLYPGGSADLSITVNNPNPYPVSVTVIEPDTAEGITVDGPGCEPENVSFSVTGGSFSATPGVLNVPVAVAAKTGSTPGSAPITLNKAVRMIADADNDCQGATFTVPVIVTGASAALSDQ
jgi:hypothetical protein